MNGKKPFEIEARQHYGLWPEDGSCKNLEEARAKLLERVLEDFPPAPARVLVAGIPMGLAVDSIVSRGYTVTLTDPSPELIQQARKGMQGIPAEFKVADFLTDDSSGMEEYDAVLFLETANRPNSLDELASWARRLLKDNGSVVIAGEMTYRRDFSRDMNVKTPADFITCLFENGFFISRKENITDLVKGTPARLMNEFSRSKGVNTESSEGYQAAGDHWEKRNQAFETGLLEYEIIHAKKSGFFMRAYAPGDEKEILGLFKQCFHAERSLEHWEWKYEENPFGSHRIALALDKEGTIAAHYAGYPVPFCLAKDEKAPPEEFLAYQNGDTMTRQSYRNVGLGKTSLLARTFTYFIAKFGEDPLSFYYGFNTDRIKILGKRYMDYNYIDPVTCRKRDLKVSPMRYPGVFKRARGRYSVQEVLEVDREWSDFFDRVCSSYGLLVKRNPRYLGWRYLECPDKIYKIFAIRKKKRLVGWGVFSFKEKNLIWGDALFDRNFPDSLDFFLCEVVKSAYPDAESIEAWFPPHPDWWNRWLDKSGFSVHPESRGLTPCAQHNPYNDRKGPSVVERERDRFFYTMGDSDLF